MKTVLISALLMVACDETGNNTRADLGAEDVSFNDVSSNADATSMFDVSSQNDASSDATNDVSSPPQEELRPPKP